MSRGRGSSMVTTDCTEVGFGESTPDGVFALRQGECFGACGDAPVMLVNNKRLLIGMTPENIDRFLVEARKAASER